MPLAGPTLPGARGGLVACTRKQRALTASRSAVAARAPRCAVVGGADRGSGGGGSGDAAASPAQAQQRRRSMGTASLRLRVGGGSRPGAGSSTAGSEVHRQPDGLPRLPSHLNFDEHYAKEHHCPVCSLGEDGAGRRAQLKAAGHSWRRLSCVTSPPLTWGQTLELWLLTMMGCGAGQPGNHPSCPRTAPPRR